jgi:hypothetical protein
MLALIATGALVAYLLIPGALYRSLFSLFIPPRNFQRTRTDEIRFAVMAGLVPLALALILAFELSWSSQNPFSFPNDTLEQRGADYRIVFGGAYSEELFRSNPAQFWHALNHVLRRQARILFWYYILLASEAIVLGACCLKIWWFFKELNTNLKWWRYFTRRCRRWIADHVLVPQVSEWYLLLSTAAFPPDRPRRVQLDVLLADDRLYRGTVARGSYFLDKDGSLVGIMLTNASRFDRRRYLSDEAAGALPEPRDYWKTIPGAKLYVPFDKVSSVNFRYEPRLTRPLTELVERLLSGEGVNADVTLE